MKFFIDTANIDEIKECDSLGILDGVTTNPSLVAKDVKNKNEVYKAYEKICEICGERPVSCEVIATEYDDIIKEARELRKIADNVCVKIAISEDGIKACKTLTEEEIMTNMTLCFSPVQALLCAKAGATFVSPFLGRLDDINIAGIDLITKIRTIFDNYAFGTEILSASIRSVLHVEQVAEVGSDVATIPYKIIKQLFKHPLTDAGLKKFLEDYKKLS